jgi:hypothetical protein
MASRVPVDLSKILEAGKRHLPKQVYCPVCGQIIMNITLKPDEWLGALASGALAARKVQCSCGLNGVFVLRKSGELPIYSLTFWIVPKVAEKQGILTEEELKRWLERRGSVPPLA